MWEKEKGGREERCGSRIYIGGMGDDLTVFCTNSSLTSIRW